MTLVRNFVGVTAYGYAARKIVVDASLQAARTRDDLPDIINVALEELARQRYELPGFSTLLKIARAARSRVNGEYQARICETLDATGQAEAVCHIDSSLGRTA
jgi:hypothetical protein